MLILFSSAYLPPVSYLTKCANADTMIIESHEHFVKQSYRNRCCIAGPNGKQSLIIPVVHSSLASIPIKDVLISFDSPWNKIHWKSITSAYRNSPYFDYFEDQFKYLFLNPPAKLFEFNLQLLKKLFVIFSVNTTIEFSKEYEKLPAIADMRNNFHPKKLIQTNPYHQVFQERNGFIHDLSIIDYLFNNGNRLLDHK